jgi:hypothetical protein
MGLQDKPIYEGEAATLTAQFYTYRTVESVDLTANTLTLTNHGLTDGLQAIVRVTGGILPAPLADTRTYYIVGAATNTLQLAVTPGGAAIDLSRAGSGFVQLGALSDPATCVLTIKPPTGDEVVLALSDLTRVSQGTYYYNYVTGVAGTHQVRFQPAGGPDTVLQYSFSVTAMNV